MEKVIFGEVVINQQKTYLTMEAVKSQVMESEKKTHLKHNPNKQYFQNIFYCWPTFQEITCRQKIHNIILTALDPKSDL